MDTHSTWFHLLPFFQNLETLSRHYLERKSFLVNLIGPSFYTLTHVVISAFVALLLVLGALVYSRRVSPKRQERLIPERRFGLRNLFELIMEAALGLAEGVMGRQKAERYFPLVGTLVFFILFNNIIGLIPGFVPGTDTLKTNLALSVLVFVMYNFYGIRAQGIKRYLKHLCGPMLVLAPLMFVIELISHVARPLSLALRLMGNMAADHKVVAAFFGLVPLLVPLPFMVLGILVCIVQTLVFSLLTMVYIDLAVAHEEH